MRRNDFKHVASTEARVPMDQTRSEALLMNRKVAQSPPVGDSSDLRSVLHEGDPDLVRGLIAGGRRFDYREENGYTALIDAVHGRDVLGDPRLLNLLQALIDAGVDLNGVSKHDESALRVLSRIGRFDCVALLLKAGAERTQLAWTPLIEAVALDSLSDVESEAKAADSLESTDYWSRTAWLVALLGGSLPKAELLLRLGANVNARGRCGRPPLHYAVQGRHPDVIRWLLDLGQDIEQTDDFGATPLICAAREEGDVACVRVLIAAGANVNAENEGGHVIHEVENREILEALLEAGASPAHLSHVSRRALCGLGREEQPLRRVTRLEFESAPTRRFGSANPERMNEPFWLGMIRSGITAYHARLHFDAPETAANTPTWCAQRFGQSLTRLKDGRVVLIAGEHEDHYDQDFCIYNDVFVIHGDGAITIHGYPQADFPPTDFHTATLVGDAIYVIGSLGYHGTRRFGHTPVFRLDLATFRMERVKTSGDGPGWIHGHDAVLASEHAIRITGGEVEVMSGDKEEHRPNSNTFILDLRTGAWRRDVLFRSRVPSR